MDDGPFRRRTRTLIALLVVAISCALVAFLLSRPGHSPDAESVAGPASDVATPPEVSLRPAPKEPEFVTPILEGVRPDVAARIHAEFGARNPTSTAKVAVTGRVVDAVGRPVLSGRINYRRSGTPWAWAQIDYDGTFEINDVGSGPYELLATQGNGPVDRHAPITSAGDGAVDLLLRAPHAGTLKIRLESPIDERIAYASLTREDAEEGVATSGTLHMADGEHVEFTGIEPGVAHVLWIHDRSWSTISYLRGVKSGADELVVAASGVTSIRGTIRSPERMQLDEARLLAVGVDARFGDGEVVCATDMTMPDVDADASLPKATFGIRLRPMLVPRIALRFEASGFIRSEGLAVRTFTAAATLEPGESIVADWEEVR